MIKVSQADDAEFRRRKRLVLAEETDLLFDLVRGQFRIREVPVLGVADDERVPDDAPVAELESGSPAFETSFLIADDVFPGEGNSLDEQTSDFVVHSLEIVFDFDHGDGLVFRVDEDSVHFRHFHNSELAERCYRKALEKATDSEDHLRIQNFLSEFAPAKAEIETENASKS